MDPLIPWIDADQVRKMAERLLTPSHQPVPVTLNRKEESGFIGFTPEDQLLSSPSYTGDIEDTFSPSRTGIADVQPQSKPASSQSPDESGAVSKNGTPFQQIPQFLGRVKREFSATDIYLLDQDGNVMFDEGRNEKLLALIKTFAPLSKKSPTPLSNVRIKLGTQASLEIIPSENPSGFLYLGLVVPEAISQASAQNIRDHLSKVVVRNH